ncbi:hypothetical protein [Polyangium spumosum]|uniref:hypothetical protein n=1 Tax=Polyangium spumosum TaxID=889282 RepID=UPI00147835A0|nr:hypothetical protein [Polyangium spumosum]
MKTDGRAGAASRRPARRWAGWFTRSAWVALAVGLAGASCESTCRGTEQPFECGVPLEGDPDILRYCAGTGEICVCATRYCAKPDDSCPSKFRYLEEPFGMQEEGMEPDCVEKEDVEGKTIASGQRELCESGSGGSGGGGGSGGSGGGGGSGGSGGGGGSGGSGGGGGSGGSGGGGGSGGSGGGGGSGGSGGGGGSGGSGGSGGGGGMGGGS